MTLPTSGPISLAQIAAEFGGPTDSIAIYTRGGLYVPNTSVNANIRTTNNNMAFNQYYGASITYGKFYQMSFATNITDFAKSSATSVIATTNTSTTYYSTSSGASGTWGNNSNYANNPLNSVAFVSGTTFIAADSISVLNTMYPWYTTTPYTSGNVWNTPGGTTTSGINGSYSCASNGTTCVIANGNVSITQSAGSLGTAWVSRAANLHTVTGGAGQNFMKYFSLTNRFLCWSPNLNPFYSYSSDGITWTSGPFPLTGPAVTGVYDMATNGTTYVMVGVVSGGGPLCAHSTNLASAAWTQATTFPQPVHGYVTKVLWIAARSMFVCVDTNGVFYRSSDSGVTWVRFNCVPASYGSLNFAAAIDLGTTSLWGTTTGYIVQLTATDIP